MPHFIDHKFAVAALFEQALSNAFPETARLAPDFRIAVEKPKKPEHGHFAVNSALHLAKLLGKKPREIADAIVAALPPNDLLLGTPEIAGPGFINLRLSQAAIARIVPVALSQGKTFGDSDIGQAQPLLVEFVSANPTGPLHVGHGRGAAVGDSIARLLVTQGFAVSREFYYNDAGAQINNLALSVQARLRERAGLDAPFPEDGYRGEYIVEIATQYRAAHSDDARGENLDQISG